MKNLTPQIESVAAIVFEVLCAGFNFIPKDELLETKYPTSDITFKEIAAYLITINLKENNCEYDVCQYLGIETTYDDFHRFTKLVVRIQTDDVFGEWFTKVSNRINDLLRPEIHCRDRIEKHARHKDKKACVKDMLCTIRSLVDDMADFEPIDLPAEDMETEIKYVKKRLRMAENAGKLAMQIEEMGYCLGVEKYIRESKEKYVEEME